MLAIVGVLLILWLVLQLVGDMGSIIHALLVIAAIVLVYDLLVARRRA
jgi:hypothetical protein